ncbi:MAG: Na+:solute symporter [Flavobacteriales bacterium]|nr:Na+:solute symporter [Bacteroidota bacterium]MCB9241875.1 Na+:solute symporter [Flavobacteriales bacterium]
MSLSALDWSIISLFLLLSFGIALYYRKQSQSGLAGFFLGGRSMPWYLAGLSMVATTFAADTPLAVTELVGQGGIAANWLWWNLLAGGLLTTIFFSRLWRRSGIITEVEFIQLRYSGKAASFLRGFKAIYLGLFINAMIIAWVNQAFMALLEVFFDIHDSRLYWITGGAMVFIFVYASISGLKGIAVTDAFQFILAMVGCIVLAVIVVNSDQIGGIQAMKTKLPEGTLNYFPDFYGTQGVKSFTISVLTFLTYVGVLWWASWYPGAEPGGGGYIAQRMMGTKSEKDSVFATLFFQIAHYCIRPWPWIIVALCAVILYPDLGADDQKLGYVMAMKEFLPSGLKGLLLVAFLGAYMSTISTQLNWGASYIVNDVYQPFIRPPETFNHEEDVTRNYLLMSRLATFLIMGIGLVVTTFITTITGVWEFIFQCGAGLGLVLILRWYWHRINVWSEITATIVPFLIYGAILMARNHHINQLGMIDPDQIAEATKGIWYFDFAWSVLLTVGLTTLSWLVVTFLTPPNDEETLRNFVERVRPTGWWQGRSTTVNDGLPFLILSWIFAIVMVYSVLFGTGDLILQEWQSALGYWLAAGVSMVGFRWSAGRGDLFQ